jgi:hypothetical protein
VLAGGLEWADPTDLDGLREALELADPERRMAIHVGWWDDAFVERLLERARSTGGGL